MMAGYHNMHIIIYIIANELKNSSTQVEIEDTMPLSALQPSRGPHKHHRDYRNVWHDVWCSRCLVKAGQIKLDPGPGSRDPPTWYMRTRISKNQWATGGQYFSRRTVTVVGETDEFCKKWILDNQLCCGKNRQ